MRRPCTLAIAAIAAVGMTGCARLAKQVGPYDGLFPPGFAINDSPVPLQSALLRTQTVAIVASTNYENYVTFWSNHFEKGGAERMQAGLNDAASAATQSGAVTGANAEIMSRSLGVIGESQSGLRHALDPRRLADAVAGVLKESFGTVIVATDFADARQKKVDYIALLDYYPRQKDGWVSSTTVAEGGVHFFDRDLKRIFRVLSNAKGTQGVMNLNATNRFETAMAGAINQIVAGMRTNLSR